MSSFSRWRGPLLIASVGVNLFLAGTFVPHLFHPREAAPGREPAPGINYLPRSLTDILPAADAELLQKSMSPDQADFKALEKQARESWAEIQALLAADRFDAQALAAALQKVADSRRAFEASRQVAVVEALSRMSPEGRKKLSELKMPFILGGMHGGPRPGGPRPDGRFDHPPFPEDGPPPPPFEDGADGPGPAGNPAVTPRNDGGIPVTPRAPTAAPVTPH